MKVVISLVASALVVAGCSKGITAAEEPMSPIASIVDRSLVTDDGSQITIRSDQTITGQIGGNAVDAQWQEVNGLFCRQGNFGDIQLGDECLTVVINGNTVTFLEPDGSVSSQWMTVADL